MLAAAFYVTGFGVVLGLVLASVALLGHERLSAQAAPAALAHGSAGLIGLGALLLALERGPPRGTHQGAGSLGVIAAALLTSALLAGSTILAAKLRGRPVSALAVGLHASLGIGAFVILAAYHGAAPD